MKITITIGKEPALARTYQYDTNTDYNEKIADMIDSLNSL